VRPVAPVLPSAIKVGVLLRVAVAHKVIVIAAQWPSWLVTTIALDIPIQEAYFPSKYHRYFKSKNENSTWMTPLDLSSTSVDNRAVYLVSGAVKFVQKLQAWFTGESSQRLIVSLEM
jgi:hypothetical protein